MCCATRASASIPRSSIAPWHEQRERARASWKGAHKEVASPAYAKLAETFRTEPDFYYGTSARDCRIEAIVTPEGPVNELPAGAEGEIVLDRTPFYAESGGQVADTGTLWNNERSLELAEVRGAYYPVTGLVAHRVTAKETLRVGDRVAGEADAARRERNKRNHTATHLMHAALRNILGTHVKQAGSLVAPDRLRFDFSHFAAVDPAELTDIEQQVNEQIRQNAEIDDGHHHARRRAGLRRAGLFRRPLSGAERARGDHSRSRFAARLLQQGALRRHARAPRGRYRRLQDRRGAVGGGGRAPHRGAHRRRGAGRLPAARQSCWRRWRRGCTSAKTRSTRPWSA